MTLLELAVVLVILIGLAGAVMPYASGISNRAACTITDASMVAIRDAIMGTGMQSGYYDDVRVFPDTIEDLFDNDNPNITRKTFNPITQRGWHGPYLINGTIPSLTTEDNDNHFNDVGYINNAIGKTVLDSWGKPIILQQPGKAANIRLVSAGPNHALDTRLDDNDALNRNDDRVIFLDLATIPTLPETLKEVQNCE